MMLRRLASVLIVIYVLGTSFLGLGTERGCATSIIILSEDFEGSWPGNWYVNDTNYDSALDYWWVSTYRCYQGSSSAWCAQIGLNSVNGRYNLLNHYYDQNMSAFMEVYLRNLTGYNLVMLSFEYWALTGTTSLSDYFDVRVWNGERWLQLWKQPSVNSYGWQHATVSIPTNATWISFNFFSDEYVGLGPYEGVYIDNIVNEGSESISPTSSVEPLKEYYRSQFIYIPCTAVDPIGTGITYIELYYRNGTTVEFTKYTTDENPTGQWNTSLIPFNASSVGGDGIYEFYTCAIDLANNREQPPSIPDAWTTIDTTPPETSSSVSGVKGSRGWYLSSMNVTLVAWDVLSGIASTMYRLDSGDWDIYTEWIAISSCGKHTLQFRSEDQAGNIEGIRTLEIDIDKIAPMLTINSPESGAILSSSSVTISWLCADEMSGMSHYNVSLDGAAFEYYENLTTSINLTGLSDGTHELIVCAIDKAGNVDEQRLVFEVKTGEGAGMGGGLLNLLLIVLLVVLVVVIVTVILLYARYREKSPPSMKSNELEPPEQPES